MNGCMRNILTSFLMFLRRHINWIIDDGKIWYIPHHGVVHPKKATLRVVFDCGATFRDTSLNKQLLQGPNLTNSLFGVLLRFRQETIALMADIQATVCFIRSRWQKKMWISFGFYGGMMET